MADYIELVIKMPTELYERLMESNPDDYDGFIEGELIDFIQKGEPLPKGATNGDMIKAMFPNFKINEEWKATRHFELRTDCTEITGIATSDWWNAPYKREVQVRK